MKVNILEEKKVKRNRCLNMVQKHRKLYIRRKKRNRYNLKKNSMDRPRLCVFRSNENIYAQVIDDKTGKTLFAASTLEQQFKKQKLFGGNLKAAKIIGEILAKKAKDAGIKQVIFDRGGYIYHGRIKALAESARASGLTL